MHALHAILALTTAPAPAPVSGSDAFAGTVRDVMAGPLMTAIQFLIPGFVLISALHKLMEHRESGGAFLAELVVKGGGAFLIVQLVKGMAGIA